MIIALLVVLGVLLMYMIYVLRRLNENIVRHGRAMRDDNTEIVLALRGIKAGVWDGKPVA